jgi:hypothetical protein
MANTKEPKSRILSSARLRVASRMREGKDTVIKHEEDEKCVEYQLRSASQTKIPNKKTEEEEKRNLEESYKLALGVYKNKEEGKPLYNFVVKA